MAVDLHFRDAGGIRLRGRQGFGDRWPVDTAATGSRWARYADTVAPPVPGAAGRLLCTDPDDQKFIDLAVESGAHTLVTRDKALLRLSRRALARHGVRVCRPETWSAELPASLLRDHAL